MKLMLLLSLAMATAACASSGNGSASRSTRDTLTAEDIQSSGGNDAFTVVQTLRPHWLAHRGTSTINMRESVKVYLDGNLMGGPEQLRLINIHSISAIRHMDGLEATQRYGLDHGNGAIIVTTRVGH